MMEKLATDKNIIFDVRQKGERERKGIEGKRSVMEKLNFLLLPSRLLFLLISPGKNLLTLIKFHAFHQVTQGASNRFSTEIREATSSKKK
jgi:hypothetical protein